MLEKLIKTKINKKQANSKLLAILSKASTKTRKQEKKTKEKVEIDYQIEELD